jgi:hypothetical protein
LMLSSIYRDRTYVEYVGHVELSLIGSSHRLAARADRP